MSVNIFAPVTPAPPPAPPVVFARFTVAVEASAPPSLRLASLGNSNTLASPHGY